MQDYNVDVGEQVENRMELDRLHNAIHMLSKEGKKLLKEYFFKDISQGKLSKVYGISQQALSKKIKNIVRKLKNILEN